MPFEQVFSGLVGLVGVLIGALVTWFIETAKKRQEASLAFYREYHSLEMHEMRQAARALLRRIEPLDLSYTDLRLVDIGRKTVDGYEHDRHQWYSLRALLYFFEKLYVFKDNNAFNKRLTKKLLGGYFCGWYFSHLQEFVKRSRPTEEQRALYKMRPYHWLRSIDGLLEWFRSCSDYRPDD